MCRKQKTSLTDDVKYQRNRSQPSKVSSLILIDRSKKRFNFSQPCRIAVYLGIMIMGITLRWSEHHKFEALTFGLIFAVDLWLRLRIRRR